MVLFPLFGGCALVTMVFALIAFAVVWGREQHARTLAAFGSLAQQHGLTQYGTHHIGGPFGRGHLDVVLTSEQRGSGKNRRSVSVTRYKLSHPNPLRMGLKVHAQSQIFGDIAEALGMVSDIRVGRRDLDEAVRIGAVDAQHAAAVLTGEEVSRAILGATALSRFYVNDSEAFAQHDGWVFDAQRFASFARPLASVVDTLAQARAFHRAPWEPELDRVWGGIAASEGFHYVAERSALAASTDSGTVELSVGVVETSLRLYARVAVARPLGYGLSLYPEGALAAVGKFFGAQDVTVGIPVIDQAYTIKATQEAPARSLLLGMSADLLRLHEAFPAALRIQDGGLEASRPLLSVDAQETTAVLRAMVRVCHALAGRTAEPQGAFR